MTAPPPELVSLAKAPSDYGAPSRVEAAVAEALRALELPQDFIREGERVVVKPNWVKEHDQRKPGPGQWEHVITHPTVIEAVTRWAASKLSGHGAVIICDAPQTDSSFSKIREYCRLDEMAERCRADYPGVDIQILDLRPEEWTAPDGDHGLQGQAPRRP